MVLARTGWDSHEHWGFYFSVYMQPTEALNRKQRWLQSRDSMPRLQLIRKELETWGESLDPRNCGSIPPLPPVPFSLLSCSGLEILI